MRFFTHSALLSVLLSACASQAGQGHDKASADGSKADTALGAADEVVEQTCTTDSGVSFRIVDTWAGDKAFSKIHIAYDGFAGSEEYDVIYATAGGEQLAATRRVDEYTLDLVEVQFDNADGTRGEIRIGEAIAPRNFMGIHVSYAFDCEK